MRKGSVLLLPFLLLVDDCVGDATTPTDAGQDVTTNDVVAPDTGSDVGNDVGDGGGGDGDAAVASKHAYAVNFTGTGSLLVFDMPLTSTSQPTVVLTSNFKTPSDVEIVPGNTQLLVVDGAGGTGSKIFIFDLPITSTSTAKVAFSIDFNAIDGAFDNEGNLWLSGFGNKLEKFAPPFSNTSVPSQTITMPTQNLFALNVTGNDLLFVGGVGHLYRINLPTDAGTYPNNGLDNQNIAQPTGIAYTNTALLISNFTAGAVEDLATPIQNTTTPTAIGATVLGNPARLHFTSGNVLGVADSKVGIVMLDPPQYNSATVTIPNMDGGAVHDVRGICFGP